MKEMNRSTWSSLQDATAYSLQMIENKADQQATVWRCKEFSKMQ